MSTTSTTITCPLCSTEGWPSSRMLASFAAHCGTAWSTDADYLNQSKCCQIIAAERFRSDLLQMEIERLQGDAA